MSYYDVKDLTAEQCIYIQNNTQVGSGIWWDVSHRLESMQMSNAIDGYYDDLNTGRMSSMSKFNPNSRFYNKDAKRSF